MFELRSTVRFIAGLFQSLSIIASVLACALWEFPSHPANENALYAAALIGGFILNTGICLALCRGLTTLQSKLFLPYIICSGFHLVISVSLTLAFAISGADAIVSGGTLVDFLYASVFLALTAFWWWSFVVVRAYRNFVREVSGEHILFHNVDFV